METILILIFLVILGIIFWALFGKGGTRGKKEKLEDKKLDKLYRRRATDKDIEEEFPEEEEKTRRKTDVQPAAKYGDGDDEFNLPYLADEIIPDKSRFKVYKRTILNSEIYAKKGDFNTAISLYQGVNERINDKNVNFKINENIDYLKNYHENLKKKREEGEKRKTGDIKSSEVKLMLEGPVSIPEKIQIGVTPQQSTLSESMLNLEKIADNIVGKLVGKETLESGEFEAKEAYESEINRLQEKVDTLTQEFENAVKKKDKPIFNESELEDVKEEIKELSKQKVIESESQKLTEKHQEDITRLKDNVEKLIDFKEKAEKEKITEEPEEQKIDGKEIKEVITGLHEKIEHLTEKESKTRKELEDLKIQNEDVVKTLEKEKEEILKAIPAIAPGAMTETSSPDEEPIAAMSGIEAAVTAAASETLPGTAAPSDETASAAVADVEVTAKSTVSPELSPETTIPPTDGPATADIPGVGTTEAITGVEAAVAPVAAVSAENATEVDKVPSLTEAKFQSGVDGIPSPGTHMPSDQGMPISSKDESKSQPAIPDSAPIQKAPKPKPIKVSGKEEDEGPIEIQLMSEYGKEDEYEDESDSLSDADIFNKILETDDEKKEEDSVEILGYKKEEKELSYEVEDPELEKKRVEEEQFYRKFLQHDKRKKKELPILKVSYDFTKLPDELSLSKDKNILEYSFYKFKPLLEKANELIKTRNVKDAINYYKVVLSQNIPFEFKAMLRKNINELIEYIEKYLSTD